MARKYLQQNTSAQHTCSHRTGHLQDAETRQAAMEGYPGLSATHLHLRQHCTRAGAHSRLLGMPLMTTLSSAARSLQVLSQLVVGCLRLRIACPVDSCQLIQPAVLRPSKAREAAHSRLLGMPLMTTLSSAACSFCSALLLQEPSTMSLASSES